MLSLTRGNLKETPLHHLISSESCVMTVLRLRIVRGITNEDLHAFLAAVAETLAEVLVVQCTVAAPEGGKELAFDANMARLKKLKNAQIQGNIISPLSLARKLACDGSKGSGPRSKCCRILIRYPSPVLWGSKKRITDRAQHGEYTSSLIDALEVTGWKSVLIISGALRDRAHWDAAAGVARRRGIKFETD
jgi:hypothetical protein